MESRRVTRASKHKMSKEKLQNPDEKSKQLRSTQETSKEIKLVSLPFYDLLYTLLPPTELDAPKKNGETQSRVFSLELSDQQIEIIQNKFKDAQVQLRFCLSDSSFDQKDLYPLNLVVKVNCQECELPPPLPVRPGEPIKRLQLPLNITKLLRYKSKSGNKINISWKAESNKRFSISIYLVHMLMSSNLMDRLKDKGVQSENVTKNLIMEKFKSDEMDNEIATTVLYVSIACPLGKIRMTTPCRASTCAHLQCYDALTYLHMNEKKCTWKCPVCDQPALYENLLIDGYFLNVINSMNLGTSDENEIQLHKDGSWSKYEKLVKKRKEDEKVNESIEIISDDDDDEGSPVKRKTVENNAPKIQTKLKRTTSQTSITDFTVPQEKRLKRAQSTTTRSVGLKRTKSSLNVLTEFDNNKVDSSSSIDHLTSSSAFNHLEIESPTIDLTLDDD